MKVDQKTAKQEFRNDNPCQKKSFLNPKTGEVTHSRCGRRSCPRCAPGYAFEIGQAMDTLHGKVATHIVLTLSNEFIKLFPKESDYANSLEYTKQLASLRAKYRRTNNPRYLLAIPDISVLEERRLIRWSSTQASKAIRKIKSVISNYLGIDINSIGYARAIEYGEHKTKRWHIHLLIMMDSPIIIYCFKNHLTYDPKRKLYFGDIPEWKYGMIRIKEMSDFRGGLYYIASYISKGVAGRITFDKKVSKMVSNNRAVVSAMLKEIGGDTTPLEYLPIGATKRNTEASIDARYEKLLRRCKLENNKFFIKRRNPLPKNRRRRRESRGT